MRKVNEIFKILKIQKRIVSAEVKQNHLISLKKNLPYGPPGEK